MSWSSFLGGIFGSGMSGLGSFLSYGSAKKLQQHQYDLNLKTLENAPSASRRGFESAGYNPLYAIGANNPGFSANSAGVSADLASGMNEGINSALAIKQNNANIKNINADTALKGQQASTERARQIQMEFQNAMYDVETHLKRKDLSTYDKRFYLNLYEQMQRAENYRANSAVSMMNAETNRMNAATQKYSAESERMNAYTNSRNATTNSYNADTNRGRRSFGAFGFNASFTPRNYR